MCPSLSYTPNGKSVYTNEFGDSKKMLYLLRSKYGLLDEAEVVDINQEIVEANNFLTNTISKQNKNIRQQIFSRYQLSNNSSLNTKFTLPQAFVIRTLSQYSGKKLMSKQSVRSYLGDYEAVQYLEDSNVLDTLLSNQLKNLQYLQSLSYRIYEGVPIFRFFKQNSDFKFGENKTFNVKVICNFEDPHDLQAHQICTFFERNGIDFELEQEQGPIQILINGKPISIDRLLMISQKGETVMKNVIKGERCLECLSKTFQKKCSYCEKETPLQKKVMKMASLRKSIQPRSANSSPVASSPSKKKLLSKVGQPKQLSPTKQVKPKMTNSNKENVNNNLAFTQKIKLSRHQNSGLKSKVFSQASQQKKLLKDDMYRTQRLDSTRQSLAVISQSFSLLKFK